jgi:hypothetical protein
MEQFAGVLLFLLILVGWGWIIAYLFRKLTARRKVVAEQLRIAATSIDPNSRVTEHFRTSSAIATCEGAIFSLRSVIQLDRRDAADEQLTLSRMAVDVGGVNAHFRISRHGMGSQLGKSMGIVRDTLTGDAQFDEEFRVDANADLARAVLDEDTRRMLWSLQGVIDREDHTWPELKIRLEQGALCAEFKGEFTPEIVALSKDLLLHLRARIVAWADKTVEPHLDRGTYRTAASAGQTPVRVQLSESDRVSTLDQGTERESEAVDVTGGSKRSNR